MKLLFKRAVIFFLILCVPLVACKADDSVEEPTQVKQTEKCPDIMEYKVGDYVFGFPRKERFVRAYGYDNNLAPTPCNEVLNTRRLEYSPTQFMNFQDTTNLNAVVRLVIVEGQEELTLTKKDIKNKLLIQNLTLNDLPEENGFYRLQYAKRLFILIPTPKLLGGNDYKLDAIYCAPAEYKSPNLMCGFKFPWKENILVRVNFSNGKFPVEKWSYLYDGVVQYIENLIIEQEPEGE